MNTLQKFILGSIYCNNLTNSSTLNSVISYLKNKIDLDTQFYTKRINDLERHGYIIIKDEFDKEINDEQFRNITTVSELYQLVKQ